MVLFQPLHYYRAVIEQLLFPQPQAARNLLQLPHAPYIEKLYLFALFNYQNKKVQTLVKYLKNHNDHNLARRLAKHMHEELLEYLSEERAYGFFKDPLVIAMPISSKSKRVRGFNQVQALSKYLSKNLDARLCHPRKIIKSETKKQALLAKSERRANVAGCFQIKDASFFSNRDCIIVDDLITTGASMDELRARLILAGARNVIGISIAH